MVIDGDAEKGEVEKGRREHARVDVGDVWLCFLDVASTSERR